MITLVCITQVLIVLCVNYAFRERDLSDISGYYGLENTRQYIYLEASKKMDTYDHHQLVMDMMDAAKKHHCILIRSSQTKQEYIWYVYSEEDVFQLMNSKRFSNHELHYTADKTYDTKTKELSLFHKGIDLVIQPFANIEQRFSKLEGHYQLFYPNEQAKMAFYEDITKKYPDVFHDIGSMERESFALSSYLKQNILPMCIITILLLGLLIILLVNQSLKTIGMLKSMGLSGVRIAKRLYGRLFGQIVLAALGSLVVAYAVIVGNVERVAWEAIRLLFMLYVGYLLGIVVVFFVTVFLIFRSPLYAFIKNRNFSRHFMNINYGYLLVALLILVPMCTSAWIQVKEQLPLWQALTQKQEALSSFVYAFTYEDGYRFEGYDEEAVYTAYSEEKPIRDPLYLTYRKDYERINAAGGLYYRKDYLQDKDILYPYAEVNMNYVKRFLIQDVNGQTVHLKDKKNTVYVLLPKSLSNLNITDIEMYGNHMEKIIIADEQKKALDLDLIQGNLHSTMPITYLVYSDSAFRLGKQVTNGMYLDAPQQALLRSVYQGKHLEIMRSKDQVQDIVSTLNQTIFMQGMVFLPSLLLIMLMVAEYTYLYMVSFHQRLFVRRVQGTSFLKVYTRIFLEASAPFLLVMAFFHKQEEGAMTLFFLVMTLLAAILVVWKRDKRLLIHHKEVDF